MGKTDAEQALIEAILGFEEKLDGLALEVGGSLGRIEAAQAAQGAALEALQEQMDELTAGQRVFEAAGAVQAKALEGIKQQVQGLATEVRQGNATLASIEAQRRRVTELAERVGRA